jgi:hypothetical protein
LTSSGARKSGDTWLCGCLIGEDCDWVNSCRLDRRGGVEFCTSTWFNGVWFGRLIGGELSKTLAAADTTFEAVTRALTSSVSDLDLDPDSSPDPILVVLVFA